MGFFNAPIAAALMLLSVVVFSSASSIAQVPSSSPSPSPSMSKEEEKALDQQYLIAKMNTTINKFEVFISKDIEEWQNDPTSNSKICVNVCKAMYVMALDAVRRAMPSVSDGNFGGAANCMTAFNAVLTTCNDCFDEASEFSTNGTVVIRPASVGNISSWARSVGTECLDTFAKYY